MSSLGGWRILTVRGVPVVLHFSLIFLIFFVVLLASNQFAFVVTESGLNPAEISGTPLIWGIVFAFSVVISVLLHELGHVIVAQAHGANVKRITLMMLGGVSQFESEPESPRVEWKTAIAGPLVSFALAGVLFSLWAFAPWDDFAFFGFWLSQLNLVLGAFNLLPAFPTDGGRVLRAVLSIRRGRLKATEIAVQVSRFFVIFFVVVGLLQINIFLLLIAFFLHAAAKSELFLIEGQSALRELKVRDVIGRTAILNPSTTIAEAAQIMKTQKTTVLPIDTSSPPYGIVDYAALKHVPRDEWSQTPVEKVEVKTDKVLQADAPADTAIAPTLGSPTSALPVIENGHVTGVLRVADLLQAIQLQSLST